MPMKTQCQNCERMVSNQFARVYGDNDGNVYRCIHCIGEDKDQSRGLLKRGGAAVEDLSEIRSEVKL